MSTSNPTPDAPVVGRLLSLNVGGPRDVPWEGKTVRTAIWKEPVDGRRMVRRINIDGDDQADRAAHGGEHRAVFVYQIESYRYWQQQLQRDDFVYGQFGENFTVEGLADDQVCIGDRYQIGDAVFEVTQPRVTCFRVGIRLDEPRMPSLLVAHHRPGFYFRVIEEGEVQAGDEIRRLQTGPEELTVADVDGLLYLPNRSRRTLERALRIPALSKGWQGSFRELLDQAEHRADARPATAWEGFAPLTVTAVHRESSTIVSFGLRPAGAAPGAWSRRRPIPHASASARRARPARRLYARIRCRRSGPTTDIGSASSSSRAGGAAGFFRSTSSPATRSTRPHPAGISCCATTTIRSP